MTSTDDDESEIGTGAAVASTQHQEEQDRDCLVVAHAMAGSYQIPGMTFASSTSTVLPSMQFQSDAAAPSSIPSEFTDPSSDGRSSRKRSSSSIRRPDHGPKSIDSPGSLLRLLRKASSQDLDNATLERAPLLPRAPNKVAHADTLPELAACQSHKEILGSVQVSTTWAHETKTLGRYSRSLILTFALQYLLPVTSVFTVGHLGKMELGAVSLGSMTANITGYAIYQGLATSLDTLCAQAYGSGKKELVGVHFQRMCCFLTLVTLPIAAVWLNGSSILAAMVPERKTAELAGLYLKVLTLGMIPYAVFEASKRFVQAQGLFSANLYALLIVTPFNIFLHWFLVWHLKWGFVGAPIALVIAESSLPIIILLYVVFVDGRQCWGGWSRDCLCNWGPMVKLAIPGLIAVESEYFAFECLTFASAWLGTVELAAQSLLGTITALTFQIPFPMSIAASTRIAHLVGGGLAPEAKLAARVALTASVFVGIFNMILLSSLRYQIPRLFTYDREVVKTVAQILPLISTFQLFDAVAANCNGILRGIGRQSIGGYVALFAYYIVRSYTKNLRLERNDINRTQVALPLSFGTGFGLNWGLAGLWCGPAVALFLVSVIECWFILNTSWEKAVEDAEARNDEG
ncbi:MAG: hypothetical protein M1828_004698 [Chrysothrix sp. TS-e1954]|nr:MAG: hypothetical protein M1828_004698 [Chrysothrix sp. TS-e1954]